MATTFRRSAALLVSASIGFVVLTPSARADAPMFHATVHKRQHCYSLLRRNTNPHSIRGYMRKFFFSTLVAVPHESCRPRLDLLPENSGSQVGFACVNHTSQPGREDLLIRRALFVIQSCNERFLQVIIIGSRAGFVAERGGPHLASVGVCRV